jgi:DNA-binding response OmpR family regulator
LVVDDEVHIRTSLSVLLRDAGYRVTIAEDGREVLSISSNANRCSEPIQLLLTDVRMPGLNGLQFIEEIGSLSTSPVFALGKRGLKVFRGQ